MAVRGRADTCMAGLVAVLDREDIAGTTAAPAPTGDEGEVKDPMVAHAERSQLWLRSQLASLQIAADTLLREAGDVEELADAGVEGVGRPSTKCDGADDILGFIGVDCGTCPKGEAAIVDTWPK